MSQFSLAERKRINRLANDTPNLVNRSTFGINSKTGALKKNYFQLDDGRIIYLPDVDSSFKPLKKKASTTDTPKDPSGTTEGNDTKTPPTGTTEGNDKNPQEASSKPNEEEE